MDERHNQTPQAAAAGVAASDNRRPFDMRQIFRTASAVQWGLAFITTLPVESVLAILQEKAKRMGYGIESQTTAEDLCIIETCFRGTFWRTICRRLPTRISWRVKKDGETTYIYCDPRLSVSYSAVLLLSFVLWALLLWFGWRGIAVGSFTANSPTQMYGSLVSVLASCGLIFLNACLCFATSSERLQPILGHLRDQALARGSYLASVGKQYPLRHMLHTLAYLFFVIAVVTMTVMRSWTSLGHPQFPWWFITLLMIAVTFIGTISSNFFFFLRFKGFGSRLLPALGVMNVTIAILMLFLAQLPWSVVRPTLTHEDVNAVKKVGLFTKGKLSGWTPTLPDGTPARLEQVKGAYTSIAGWAWGSLGLSALLLVMGTFFFIRAFDVTVRASPYLYQMKRRPDISWSQETINPSAFLRPFRIVWGMSWFLLALSFALCLWGLGYMVLNLFRAVMNVEPSLVLNNIDVSVFMAAIATGVDPNSFTFTRVVYLVWGLYISLCVGVVMMSVGSFIVQEILAKRRLFEARSVSAANIRSLMERLGSSLQKCGSTELRPELVLVSSRFPYAQARCVGLWKARRVIEVSDRCVRELTEQQMHALLAHEMAHHRLGHCRRDQVLRLLGRMTFIGDGFVRILEDSFGYEMEADRFAVTELRADPRALIESLQKLRMINAIENLRAVSSISGPAIAASDEEVDQVVASSLSLAWPQRLKLGARLLAQQYFGLKHSGYWHPPVAHRVAALQAFQNAEVGV